VGGGITGLAAAYRLRRTAPWAAVTLLESERRLGGKIVTENAGGFLVEGGPDSFLSSKPGALELCRELGLERRLCGTLPGARRAYVLRRGRLHPIPGGISGLVPSRLGPLLRSRLFSPFGKARMGLELLLPPRRGGPDESLASFVRRRLGREAYERLVEPLMAGIYAGDGERLSLQATFPQLGEMERRSGGVLRGLLRRQPAGPGSAGASPFLTLEGGLGELVSALEDRLEGVDVRLGEEAVRLERAPGGWRVHLRGGEPLESGAVLLAAPAFACAGLLEAIDPDLARELHAIPHASTATVTLAWPLSDLPRPLDGTGYIVPRAEGRAVLACSWSSSKFPHRAPEGWATIRVFVGRAGDQGAPDAAALDDGALWSLARREAQEVLGVTAAPAMERAFRWPRGMPQYTLGHIERLAAIERRLSSLPGLALAGNAYRGVGIPDCIRSGEEAAGRLHRWLERLRPEVESGTRSDAVN
jgi:oxygen-dependent protoporphyrinogen oxidase